MQNVYLRWLVLSCLSLSIGIDLDRVSAQCAGTPNAGFASPSAMSVCYGTGGLLSLVGHDSGPDFSYQWEISSDLGNSWQELTGETEENLTIPTTASPGFYLYRCKVTCNFSLDFAYSAQAQFEVYEPISISAYPINPTCPGGCDGAIWVDQVTGGSGSYSFDPSINGNIFQSGLCASTNPVTISDNIGCSSTVVVDITDPTPTVVDFVAGSICEGDVAILSANIISGQGPFTYSWYPNHSLSANDQQSVLANPTSSTVYSVDVKNANGCVVTAFDQLTVFTLPSISISAQNGGNISAGSSETLTASGAQNYVWSDGSSIFASGNPITVSPTTSTHYTVYGTDNNGCTNYATYFVNVISGGGPINVNVLSTDVTCFGLNDGTINLVVNGGDPPYTFSWSNGSNSQNLSNLAPGTYFVTITDASSNSAVASATINEPLPLTISTNYLIDEVCGGNNGEISIEAQGGTANYGYSWSNGQNTSLISGLSAGNYTVTVTDNNGCLANASYTLSNTFLSANIHGTALINGNFLSSGKAYLYEITDTTAYILRDSTILNTFGEFDFSINQSANYLVMVKPDRFVYPNAASTFFGDEFKWNLADTVRTNCGSRDTVVINVITYNPAIGGHGLITGTVIDITDSTDQRRPGEPIPGVDIILESIPGGTIVNRTTTDNNGEYAFSNVANGNYKIFASVPGCLLVNTYNLSISGHTYHINRDFYVDSLDGYIDTSTAVKMQVCVYTPQYSATTVCLGDTTFFTDLSVGVPTAISGYRWDFDGDAVADDTTKGNVKFVYQTAGVFNTSLTIFTYDGVCSITANLQVTVNDLPRVVVSPDTAVCTSHPLTLIASGAETYSWVNDPSIALINNEQAFINTSSPFTKSFYVFGMDSNGCINADTAEVTVNQGPTANFLIKNSNICLGDLAEFRDTSLNVVPGTTYAWDFNNDGIVDNHTSGSVSFQYSNPGGYNVELTLITPNGCTDSVLKTITVRNNPLIVSAGYDKSIICGASTPLQAYCNTTGVSYLWTPNYYLGNPFVASTTATPDTTTSYVIKVSKDGCSAYDTVIVYVTPLTVDGGTDARIICGNSVTLNGTSNGVAGTLYQWTPATGLNSQTVLKPSASPIVTTTYVITAYKNTCFASDTVTVFVDPISISAGSDKSIICGQSTTLTATSPGSSGLIWSWTPVQGLNNPSSANVTASPTTTTDYILTGFKGNCVSRDTVRITVTPFDVYAGPDKVIDCGNSTQLQATSFYTSGVTYNWSPATGLSNALSLTPTASPAYTTTYTLTVTKGNCVSSDTVTVVVNQEIPLSFSADKTIFANKYPPYTVKFTNNTPNPNNYIFKWDFGDNSPIVTARNYYTHSYLTPGTFTVSLFAENLNGTCKDTLTFVDYIVAWSPVAIPNQLSVNYDVEIFPNPGAGIFTLGLNDNKLESGIVSVIDLAGKVLIRDLISLDANNQMKLDLSDFSPGVYFIKLENDHHLVVKRYIKE